MLDKLLRTYRAIRDRTRAVGRWLQARLLVVSLVLIYLLGLGLARLYASVFRRELLASARPEDSPWLPAEDYGFDPERSTQPS